MEVIMKANGCIEKNEYTYNSSKEEKIENEDAVLEISSESENVYPMNHIKVNKNFYSVFELKRKQDRDEKRIILDSDFQRESVWKIMQKIELVESVLMGLPLPVFYFNEDKTGRLIVIDGRQRLTALFEFMNNDFALKNLRVLPDLNGCKFNDLSTVNQSRIEDYQIQANVIQPPTPDKIQFDIFERVNRTGTILNKQEIRNALYQGKATQLLKEITQMEEFTLATGDSFKKDVRMKGRYLIIRFLALEVYLSEELVDDTGKKYEYKNDIDDLLGRTMDYINQCDEDRVKRLKELTVNCLEKSHFYLGKDGFRLIKSGERKTPINMNIFECFMHFMKSMPKHCEEIKDVVRERLEQVLQETDFLQTIAQHRDSWSQIKKRFTMLDDIAKEITKT